MEKTYRSHEQSEHGAQAAAHDARHDCLADAGLHGGLHLCVILVSLMFSSFVWLGIHRQNHRCCGVSRTSRTIFTICCSCSDMPALGFMAAGIAPGPPGKAIMCCDTMRYYFSRRILQYAVGDLKNERVVWWPLSHTRARRSRNFAEFARRTGTAGKWERQRSWLSFLPAHRLIR